MAHTEIQRKIILRTNLGFKGLQRDEIINLKQLSNIEDYHLNWINKSIELSIIALSYLK